MTNLELLQLEKTWREKTPDNELITLAEALEKFDVDELLFVAGQWAITLGGIECLVSKYFIEKSRITVESLAGWSEHISRKNWANINNFIDTYTEALNLFEKPTFVKRQLLQNLTLRRRFGILRRDGYKCRLCGATASMGARLEIDHIEPKAKGGNDSTANLWTLCFECNRGKTDGDL